MTSTTGPDATATAPVTSVETTWRPVAAVDVRQTLWPFKRGSGDPSHQLAGDGAIWRTSHTPDGPTTYRIDQRGPREIHCQAWGDGARWLIEVFPDLLGRGDDATGFEPGHPLLVEAHRRNPGLRVPRSHRVLEALVPAVLEQKVTSVQAWSAWRWLLRRHGLPAPGPAPAGMRVPPTAEIWRRVPSWDWHRAGVEPVRSRTIIACARVAGRLEECDRLPRDDAYRRLTAVPGVGEWTAAEVAGRALGDADALSVGDYHLAKVVGWALTGESLTDAEMVELLAPWRPHRYRVVRLVESTPSAHPPRRGPRMTIQDHRAH